MGFNLLIITYDQRFRFVESPRWRLRCFASFVMVSTMFGVKHAVFAQNPLVSWMIFDAA